MTKDKKKSSKKCGKNKKLMVAYGSIQLGSNVVSALALTVIALGFCSLNKESKVFNQCVQEVQASGINISDAVAFCNGGN